MNITPELQAEKLCTMICKNVWHGIQMSRLCRYSTVIGKAYVGMLCFYAGGVKNEQRKPSS